MIWILIGTSLLFVALGFIVTEKNAGTLLAGYNTLSKEDKAKADIRSYLAYFREFHIILGISYATIGLIANYLLSKNIFGTFLIVYPILAYTWFAWQSNSFSKRLNPKFNKTGFLILTVSLIFVSALIGFGFKEDKLVIGPERIEIKGMYGEELKLSDIKNIAFTSQMPDISMRTNGFSLGSVKKGLFRTKEGETIKLILNSEQRPYILFTKRAGMKIYYSAKEESNEKLYNKIIGILPDSTHN